MQMSVERIMLEIKLTFHLNDPKGTSFSAAAEFYFAPVSVPAAGKYTCVMCVPAHSVA